MIKRALLLHLLRYLKALASLEGALVEAFLFDDPQFKHEVYTGEIQEVKETAYGPYVRFASVSGPSHITGSKWIRLSKVIGLAPITQKATA